MDMMGLWMAKVISDTSERYRNHKAVALGANEAQTEVKLLRAQVERMALLNQALWELLRERLGLSDAELERMAQEVDMRDGIADGKMTARAVRCPACARVNNSRHAQCLYCGQPFQTPLFGGP